MPYEWSDEPRNRRVNAQVWPHKSMTPQGFTWFIGITASLLTIPLFPLLGTLALWGLLPFLLLVLAGVWFAIRRNQSDLGLFEELEITPERIAITRHNPRGPRQTWDANPHWVEIRLNPDGKVKDYLTLRGANREVELGAFLSPAERRALHSDLQEHLVRMKSARW